MPSLKALRTRIRSVKNTQQITRTMKMVAAAKVRRARAAVEASRPYSARLLNVLTELAQNSPSGAPALLTGRAPVPGRAYGVRLVVCGSDRGLAGGLNANLLKAAARWLQNQQQAGGGRRVEVVAVGRKIRDGLKLLLATMPNVTMVATYTDMGRNVEFDHAKLIAAAQLADFEAGAVDEVQLLCAECVSMLSQPPSFRKLIPFGIGTSDVVARPGLRPVTEYEPDEETVLARLLPLNLNVQVFSALLESSASEQAARMTAMDAATRNAGQLVKKLTVAYNRTRQAAITTELIEIIAGAEAV